MLKDFPVADFSVFSAPIEKLIALNTAKFEAAVATQTAAAQELVALTEARAKALSEVKDFDGYSTFLKAQGELAQTSLTKSISDSQSAVEEAKAYGEEVQKIMTESIEVATKAAKKAAKKAA